MAIPRILCPVCDVPIDPSSAVCPSCSEDLSVLAYLSYAALRHFNDGLRLAQDGEHSRAIAELGRAVELDPDFIDAYVVLGKIHGQAGERSKAAEALRRARELSPEHGEALAALTYLHSTDALLQRAIAWLLRNAQRLLPIDRSARRRCWPVHNDLPRVPDGNGDMSRSDR